MRVSVVSVAVKTGAPTVVDVTVKVTTPEPSDTPDAAEMVSVAPRLEARVTVFPATGLELASFRVTVMVEVVVPSAVMEVGLATTVDWAAVGVPAANVTVAVCVIVIVSVVSVAVKTPAPEVLDFTVKVTIPEILGPDAAEIVSVAPRLDERVTVFPETGLESASFNVTVIIEVLLPSAITDAGLELTVDCAAVTGPGTKVTVPPDFETGVAMLRVLTSARVEVRVQVEIPEALLALQAL